MVYAIVFVLTLIDAVCTYIGVSTGLVAEGNVLLVGLVELNLLATCMGVVVLNIIVLIWLKQKEKHIRWIPKALVLVVIVKLFVVGMHAAWIVLSIEGVSLCGIP